MSMTTVWILVMYLNSFLGKDGGPIALEFNSRSACEHALETVKREMPWKFDRGVCVPKSDEALSTGKENG